MDDFYEKLYSLHDLKYKEFHQKLIKKEIIGIRTPKLKEIAKKISKHNYIEYINNCKHRYYEDTIIHGLIITYLNIDFNEIIALFDDFIPYIDKIVYNKNITDNSFINIIYRLILDNGINKFYALLKPIKNICKSDIKNIIFEGFNFDDKTFILE